MKKIEKPEGLAELGKEYGETEDKIRVLESGLRTISENAAELFTSLRVGETVWIGKAGWLVMRLGIYRREQLKEDIYNQQFVVEVTLVKKKSEKQKAKDLLFRQILMTAEGVYYDKTSGMEVKLEKENKK